MLVWQWTPQPGGVSNCLQVSSAAAPEELELDEDEEDEEPLVVLAAVELELVEDGLDVPLEPVEVELLAELDTETAVAVAEETDALVVED